MAGDVILMKRFLLWLSELWSRFQLSQDDDEYFDEEEDYDDEAEQHHLHTNRRFLRSERYGRKESCPKNISYDEEERKRTKKHFIGSSRRSRENLLLTDLGITHTVSFSEKLFELIDQKGLTDAEVYKKAGIDRRLFSKIRCEADYHPSKQTVLALALTLRLELDELNDLMKKAGYVLSDSISEDLIIAHCIDHRVNDGYSIIS